MSTSFALGDIFCPGDPLLGGVFFLLLGGGVTKTGAGNSLLLVDGGDLDFSLLGVFLDLPRFSASCLSFAGDL